MQSIEILKQLQQLQQHGILSALDVQFARFLTHLAENVSQTHPHVTLTAALTSYFTTQGHVCIDLTRLAEQPFPLETEAEDSSLLCPPLAAWLNTLQCSPLVTLADKAVQYPAPLVLHEQRVYLYRYWQYEQQLAANIQQRLAQTNSTIDIALLNQGLTELFEAVVPDTAPDWQRIAAQTAVLRHFCIVSGGPGTGKTSTVVKILLLLLMQNPHLRIALAAPTGKAAARMQAAIVALKPRLKCSAQLKTLIPEETYTIHRLLGTIPDSPYFRCHADNPLLYDVVVVDEASMVDLALMAKLAQAIPLASRWILLGDKDQLASVETGTVLGDLCSVGHIQSPPAMSATPSQTLANAIVLLRKSYRFQMDSGIGQLARQIQQGAVTTALELLQTAPSSPNSPDLAWLDMVETTDWQLLLAEQVLNGFKHFLAAQHPRDALLAFEQFRILCALRRGPFGVMAINRLVEHILIENRLIEPGYQWYHRRPIMITRNDYNLSLFNGDIGVVFWNPQRSGELQAFFPTHTGELRSFGVNRLPEHETVYAMTIHKSQGSEFDRVLMILSDHISPILSRELVYTGITRARHHVSVWSHAPVFATAVHRQIYRTSGLCEAFVKNKP